MSEHGGGGRSARRTLAPLGRRRAQVLAVDRVGAYHLLRCADPDGPAPRPGQFQMLAAVEAWGGGEEERPWLPRAFSHLRHDTACAQISFLLEAVGPGTRRLARLAAGEELWLLGPLGQGFAPPPAGDEALLVGGGIGIVPLAGWQDELRGAGVRAPALLGFRDAAHALAAELLEDVELVTDDGSAGGRALVTAPLARRLTAERRPDVVYACGPPAMLEAVRLLCVEHGVTGQLALEAGMACGFGACHGCVVATRQGYRRVCVDGPVLEAAELVEGALSAPATAAATPPAGPLSAVAGRG